MTEQAAPQVPEQTAPAQEWDDQRMDQVESQGRSLIKVIPGLGLVPLGTRDEVKEIARRIQLMSPQYNYTMAEAWALAQYALSLAANPIPAAGEVWLMKNKLTNEVIGFMPGYKLYEKRANEFDDKHDDHHWFEYFMLTNDERELFCVPPDALAVKAILRRTNLLHIWAQSVGEVLKAGATFAEAKVIFGDRPYVEGIGVLTRGEIEKLDKSGAIKYPHINRAKKRARVEAYKQAYHLDFGFIPIIEGKDYELGAVISDDYIDVKASVVPEKPPVITVTTPTQPAGVPMPETGTTPEGQAAIAEIRKMEGEPDPVDPAKSDDENALDAALGRPTAMFPEQPPKPVIRDWPPAIVEGFMEKYNIESEKHARARLNLSCLPLTATLLDTFVWGDIYEAFKKAQFTPAESAAKANMEYTRTALAKKKVR